MRALGRRMTSLRSPSCVRRAWAHPDVLGPHRQPLDPLAETAGVPVRISDAYGLDDHGRPIFLISTMAMHTQNLQADARASLLVTQDDTGGDPLGASRDTLVGNVLPLPESEVPEPRELYLARYANSRCSVDFEE